jgi:hypothetical protein
MERLKPGQILQPTEPLHNYRDFDQTGLPPGERKLRMFQAALRARGTPALYTQEGRGDDATVFIKLFDPCGSATWHLLEWDGQEEAFGFVTGLHSDEHGYIPLRELAFVAGRLGIGIEIETGFLPTTLGRCRNPKALVA